MLKFAKNEELHNEKVNVNIINTQICRFENGKQLKENIRELEVCLQGILDKNEYALHFIINEPIETYLKLNKGEKIQIQNIVDNYFNINGTTYLDTIIDLEVLRIDKKYIFLLIYKDCDNEFFGTSEFVLELDKLESE